MRISLLILLLFNIVFGAAPADSLRLKGSKAWQTVTINHLAVGETTTHFLYQKKIPRVGAIASNVDAAADVGITRINDTTRMPRWVIFSADTIYIYSDIAVSSTVDTSYRIHFGKALTEVNTSATFTNSDMSQYFGFNEAVGSTQSTDYIGGIVTNSANSGVVGTGLYSVGSAELTASARFSTGTNTILSNKSAYTVSLMVRPTSLATNSQVIINNAGTAICFQIYKIGASLVVYVGATNFGTVSYSTAGLSDNKLSLISVIFDGGQADNASRLKFYVDGVLQTLTFTGTIPTVTPTDAAATLNIGNVTPPNSLIGKVDEVSVATVARSQGSVTSRYNMLMSMSTFSTLGDVQSASTTGSRWSAYKQAYKSAYKKAWR